MADENLPGISEDTKSMLEDHVKKGKARKFILIAKGASIKTLIVFKKGPYGPKVNQAKKDGFRGQAYLGVITGKGVNVTFQLPGNPEVSNAMKCDGNVYEGEPVKTAKLRKFFQEEAELKFKPEFEVIKKLDDVTSVSELEDEEEVKQADSAQEDLVDEALKKKLVEKIKQMTPLIQQAITNNPNEKEKIMAPVAEIKGHIQADQLDDAKQKLVTYVGMLKTLIGEKQSTSDAAPPPPPPPPSGDSAKQSEWDWRLKELTPKLKKVLAEKLGDFAQVAAEFKAAKGAKDSDVAAAVDHLKKCAALVEAALKEAEGEWEDSTQSDYLDAWKDVSAEFTSQRSRIEKALPGKLGDYDKLINQAKQLADSGNYQEAIQLAMQAAEIEAEASKAATSADVKATIPENVVQDRKKFLLSRWQDAIKAAYVEVEKLEKPIADQVPDEDPKALVNGINDALDDFVDEFNNAIIGAQAASAKDTRPLDFAMKAIANFRSKLATNELIAQLDQAKAALGVEIKVKENLNKALDDLETRLAG